MLNFFSSIFGWIIIKNIQNLRASATRSSRAEKPAFNLVNSVFNICLKKQRKKHCGSSKIILTIFNIYDGKNFTFGIWYEKSNNNDFSETNIPMEKFSYILYYSYTK